ncbi:MAG TPA: DUF2933 domain-containing protein [Methylococcus sp.]|nr:DUF2933 domain-containing protein [Methylococcus sp.]
MVPEHEQSVESDSRCSIARRGQATLDLPQDQVIHPTPSGWRHKIALMVFLAVSLYYLTMEHTVHLFGVASYFLVVVSSLMYFLLHGSRGIYSEQGGHDS